MKDEAIIDYIWNRDAKGIHYLEEKYNKYLRTKSYNILGNNQDVVE